jgi:hypothetical protein
MTTLKNTVFTLAFATLIAIGATVSADEPKSSQVLHRTVKIDALDIFYREAGPTLKCSGRCSGSSNCRWLSK